jgi:3-oxoacyl-[acyl-carrier-protein] synthase II
MTLATGMIAPTINYKVPDPECDLDYVPNCARRARVDTVMVNSLAFGGTHGCLLLRRYSE